MYEVSKISFFFQKILIKIESYKKKIALDNRSIDSIWINKQMTYFLS